tara:strand:- start:337 stop:450 length:114 start_codon:yes stop_codon:yes gene_type:complete
MVDLVVVQDMVVPPLVLEQEIRIQMQHQLQLLYELNL